MKKKFDYDLPFLTQGGGGDLQGWWGKFGQSEKLTFQMYLVIKLGKYLHIYNRIDGMKK